MIPTSRRRTESVARRVAVVGVLAGVAVLAPIEMARGAPQTRLAVLPVTVDAAPAPAFIATAAEFAASGGAADGLAGPSGPSVPPPAGEAVEVPFPASHLGVRWQGSEEALVDVRVAGEDGRWGHWRHMLVDHDLGDHNAGRFLSQLVRVDGARHVQARVAGDARRVELLAIDTRFGPRPWVQATARAAGAADPPPQEEDGEKLRTEAAEGVPQPEVVTRAQWGADESLRRGAPKFAPLSKLFVHHTVTSAGNPDPDPPSTVRAIYAYHIQGNGWDDIGYNFLIDHAGRIYEGRYARYYAPGEIPTGEDTLGHGVVGAHVAGHNIGSVGVAVIGDYRTVEPTSPSMAAVERILAWKADRHNIDPQGASPFTASNGTTRVFPNVAGHRDAGATACPGDRIYVRLPDLRQRVAKAVVLAQSPVKGYWVATADGRVLPFGDAASAGSMAGTPLSAAIVGMAPTSTGAGYWLLGADGGVFSFGDATFYGSTGDRKLNRPVVGMAPTPTGKGYWFVASDGGIFAFGDAGFFGSTGDIKLNQPVVGMAATPTGEGYWLVASDGGIFAFGDARFFGSTGAMRLHSPVVSMAPGPSGTGYWLVARDGGVFAFDVRFLGSIPGLNLDGYPGTVQLRSTPSGGGYYIADAAGGIFAFGDAGFHGAEATQKPPAAAVDLALRPPPPVSAS